VPTSGNSGTVLAFVAVARGIPLTLTMTETMRIERRKLLLAYCAKLAHIEGAMGMKGAFAKAEEIAAPDPKYFRLQQFTNAARPAEQKRAMDPGAFFQLEKDNEAFRRFAYDSHPKTYIDGGLLKLQAGDRFFISKNPDPMNLFSMDGLDQNVDSVKPTGLRDSRNLTTATGSEVERGVAGNVESRTKAIADWWGR
jgi:hypothetical protein